MDSGSAEAALQVSVRNDVSLTIRSILSTMILIFYKEEVDNMKTHEV